MNQGPEFAALPIKLNCEGSERDILDTCWTPKFIGRLGFAVRTGAIIEGVGRSCRNPDGYGYRRTARRRRLRSLGSLATVQTRA
jgi:hypothetical protein